MQNKQESLFQWDPASDQFIVIGKTVSPKQTSIAGLLTHMRRLRVESQKSDN